MAGSGGGPYAYREVNNALQRYLESNPPPDERPLVLAYVKHLLFNPDTEGVVVQLEDGNVGFTIEVPKTQAFITWTPDHAKRDLWVYRIENLQSLIDGGA